MPAILDDGGGTNGILKTIEELRGCWSEEISAVELTQATLADKEREGL